MDPTTAAADFASAGHTPNAGIGQARLARQAEEAAAAQAAAAAHGAAQRDGTAAHRTAPGVTRDTRKPFGNMEQKLYWPKRAGFHRHWFNDTPGRIDAALAAGYAHVHDSRDKPVNRVVGKSERGGGMIAYLMEIPEEWFQEDMREAQKIVDKTMQDIHRGKAGPLGQQERYVPRQGITVRDESR